MAPRAAPGLKDKVHMKVFDKVCKQLLGVGERQNNSYKAQ
jgi:hypothetical protein